MESLQRKCSLTGVMHRVPVNRRMDNDDAEKARILHLYDDGEIPEDVARQLLGDDDFEDAVERARGAERMLSGDTSRFISRE